MVLAAPSGETALALIELGAVVLGMAVLARLASRWGITAIPFYLLAGLAVGEGGAISLDVSEAFISRAADIGVLLLLLTLGLEYTPQELRSGPRTGIVPGLIDAAFNFVPGLVAGLVLGWDARAAVLLGGVCWVSSSGVVAKIVSDLDWLGNRDADHPQPAGLRGPRHGGVPAGGGHVRHRGEVGDAVITVVVALVVVVGVLVAAIRWGGVLSRMLSGASNESLLLAVFGLTLLAGGLAEQVDVSAAIGAFLVGLALSGPVQERAGTLIEPLGTCSRRPSSSSSRSRSCPALSRTPSRRRSSSRGSRAWPRWPPDGSPRAGPGWGQRAACERARRWWRCEFSIVIASSVTVADGDELLLAAAYVLLTAVAGPVAAKYADHLAPAAGGAPSRNGGLG